MDLIYANIANLTSLWQTVGESANAHYSTADFDYCTINYSEWPNKLWFHHDLTEDHLRATQQRLRSTPVKLGIPYFDIYASQSYELLEAHKFEQQSEQVGMVLPLSRPLEQRDTLHLERVADESAARQWEDLFQRAFGYHISYRLLLPHYTNTHFLTAFREPHEPVGTAILHHTDDRVMGVHSMSILPEMRRKGLAEEMMRHLLNQSLSQGFEYATLQASDMGKGLYLKLGFREQFVMKNYLLAG